jgi:hypothetical protein
VPARRVVQPALVTAGYLLLTCVFYWPGVRHISSQFISDGRDGADFLWNYWALPHNALHGHNPFSSTGIFWPVGVRLAFHTTTPLEAFVFWPLSKVLGDVLASNLLLLAAVPLTAGGVYLLALHECGDARAAFVAGAAFTLIPERIDRIDGHWNIHHGWPLPFALWLLLRLYDRPTWRRAAALGAMAGAVLLTELTYFVFFVGAALVIAAWRWRATIARAFLGRVAAAAAVCVVVTLPLLVSLLRDLQHHELDHLRHWGGAELVSSDLLGWIVPNARHPLWGGLFAHLSVNFGAEAYPFAGLVVLGLAVAAVAWRATRPAVGAWAVIALGSAVLALGPFLHVNGWTGSHFSRFGVRYSVPLPFMVFRSLPLLSGLRVPGRFSIMTALALDVMAAVALARLWRDRPSRQQWAVAAVVLAVTLVELLPVANVRLQSPAVPAAYRVIQHAPDHDAVLEVPLFWRDGFGQYGDAVQNEDSIFLYYATRHGHPVSNGMVARLPQARLAALFGYAPYRQLLHLQHQVGFTDLPTFTARDLRAMGIGWVVYHRDHPFPDVLAYLQSLGLTPAADDGVVQVWRVPPG